MRLEKPFCSSRRFQTPNVTRAEKRVLESSKNAHLCGRVQVPSFPSIVASVSVHTITCSALQLNSLSAYRNRTV